MAKKTADYGNESIELLKDEEESDSGRRSSSVQTGWRAASTRLLKLSPTP